MKLKDGIQKIFYAEIINLCVLCFGFITSFIYLIGGGTEGVEESGLKVPLMILAILFVIALLVGFVLFVWGIVKIKDESKLFNYAFICLIVDLAVSLLAYVFDGRIMTTICNLVASVAAFLTVYFFLNGLVELFKSRGNDDLALKGAKLVLIYVILYAVGTLVNAVSGFLPYEAETVSSALDLVGSACEGAALVLIILYLKKVIPALDSLVDEKVEEPKEESPEPEKAEEPEEESAEPEETEEPKEEEKAEDNEKVETEE